MLLRAPLGSKSSYLDVLAHSSSLETGRGCGLVVVIVHHIVSKGYGIYDEFGWIPEGCRYFVSLASKAGLTVTEATFEGGHQGSLDSRIAEFMIPFFAANLTR